MFHAPIYGSQVNQPAKLFKRFTPTENVELGNKVIAYENNLYKNFYNIKYVEATEQNSGEFQPIKGLQTPSGYMTIKFHGCYKAKPGDTNEPEVDDLIVIDDKLWQVDGVQKRRHTSLVNFATIYLSLKKVK